MRRADKCSTDFYAPKNIIICHKTWNKNRENIHIEFKQ